MLEMILLMDMKSLLSAKIHLRLLKFIAHLLLFYPYFSIKFEEQKGAIDVKLEILYYVK